MATAISKLDPTLVPLPFSNRLVPVNSAPPDFDPARDLPEGFLEFLAPLHAALTLRQRALVARRDFALAEAHAGKLPDYLPPSVATTNSWRIELPAWCADQRNQMTGPADDAELVVKMLNSGAPGVMLDLEDSTANAWEHNSRGIKNIWKRSPAGSPTLIASATRPWASIPVPRSFSRGPAACIYIRPVFFPGNCCPLRSSTSQWSL